MYEYIVYMCIRIHIHIIYIYILKGADKSVSLQRCVAISDTEHYLYTCIYNSFAMHFMFYGVRHSVKSQRTSISARLQYLQCSSGEYHCNLCMWAPLKPPMRRVCNSYCNLNCTSIVVNKICLKQALVIILQLVLPISHNLTVCSQWQPQLNKTSIELIVGQRIWLKTCLI